MSELKPLRPLKRLPNLDALLFYKNEGKWTILTDYKFKVLNNAGKSNEIFSFGKIKDKNDLELVKSLFRKTYNTSIRNYNKKVKVYNDYAISHNLSTFELEDFPNDEFFIKLFSTYNS